MLCICESVNSGIVKYFPYFCTILTKTQFMKSLVYTAIAAVVAATTACNQNAAGTDAPALTTDTITLADSLNYEGSTAEVTINGRYPAAGAQALVDSARQWLAESLSWGTYSTDKPLIRPTQAQIANGAKLIDHVCGKLLASAKRDFIYLAADSIKTGYEYQITFAPAYEGDSLLTYEYNTYCYLGGAHGGAVARVATFTVPGGRLLTYANTFLPDRRKELIMMVRNALWQQYFRPTAGDEGAPSTLREALLIDPDSLDLPICGPQFGPTGVTFTYGQYEVAPYAAGMPACTLPYAELRPIMCPEVLPLLPANL